uniref:Uncharacterized protein n=1 Tax=Arundo donax TaxID=35708 RepID=A0A0A8Z6A0_ARUDO
MLEKETPATSLIGLGGSFHSRSKEIHC